MLLVCAAARPRLVLSRLPGLVVPGIFAILLFLPVLIPSFVLNGDPVLGVSLLPQVGATSAAGWNLPELRILEKP